MKNMSALQVTKSSAELNERFDDMLQLIQESFGVFSDRTNSLLLMYHELKEFIMHAPAASNAFYHNSYVGGYMDHVMNVVTTSQHVVDLYQSLGGTIDFTNEERIFAALHHDLYKIGDGTQSNYIIETDDKKVARGAFFRYNDSLSVMTGSDRTLFLLQKYGVTMTENEIIGIKCADGLYDESNKSYFMPRSSTFPKISNIRFIMHWADHMAANIEKDTCKKVYEASV